MLQPGEPGELIALKLKALLARWIFFSWFSYNLKLPKGCCHEILPHHGVAPLSAGETSPSCKGKWPKLSKPQHCRHGLWERPWPAHQWPWLHHHPWWCHPGCFTEHGGRSKSPSSSWTAFYWRYLGLTVLPSQGQPGVLQDLEQGSLMVPLASAQAGHPHGSSHFPAHLWRGSRCQAGILPGHLALCSSAGLVFISWLSLFLFLKRRSLCTKHFISLGISFDFVCLFNIVCRRHSVYCLQ